MFQEEFHDDFPANSRRSISFFLVFRPTPSDMQFAVNRKPRSAPCFFSRSGWFFILNPLLWLLSLAVSWIAFDPFVQAVYTVRCFHSESVTTGEDLRAGMRRIRIPLTYDINWQKPPPLVEREWRFTVNERIAASGEIRVPLDVSALEPIVEEIKRSGM
jgi:hypothetical protein